MAGHCECYSCWRVHRSPGLFLCFGGWGGWGVITFLVLRSLGLFFVTYFYVTLAGCRIILHATRRATLLVASVMLRWHAAASSCTQDVMLRLLDSDGARAWMTAGKHLGIKCYQVSHQRKEFCRSLSEVDPKLSKKAGTQVIDRKWKALKDFLPSNYHRKINGPHGSQVNPLMRKRVFQFCWRNSLQSPSPAQFLKHLAKLQCKKKCSGVSFQDDEKLPSLPDV